MVGGLTHEKQMVTPKEEILIAAMSQGRQLGEGYKYGPWEWQGYVDAPDVQGPPEARKKFSANLEKMGYHYIDDKQFKFFIPQSEVEGFKLEKQYIRSGGISEEYRQNKNLKGSDFKSVGAAWIMDRYPDLNDDRLRRKDKFLYCNDIKWTGTIKNGLLDGAGDGYVIINTNHGDECYSISGVFENGIIKNAIISRGWERESTWFKEKDYSTVSITMRPLQDGIRVFNITDISKDEKRKLAPYSGLADENFQIYSPKFDNIKEHTKDGKLIATYKGVDVIITPKGEIIGINSGITDIPRGIFSGYKGITSITIPEGVVSIGDNAFENSTITTVNIPSSLKRIGMRAFSYCSNLKTIQLPSELESIGSRAFSHCGALTSIVIPNSVNNIGDNAFDGCKNLTSAFVPKSLDVIGYAIFSGCTSLKSVSVHQKTGKVEKNNEWYWYEYQSPEDRKATEEKLKSNRNLANSASWPKPSYDSGWKLEGKSNGIYKYSKHVGWSYNKSYTISLDKWSDGENYFTRTGIYTNYSDAEAATYFWLEYHIVRTNGLKERWVDD